MRKTLVFLLLLCTKLSFAQLNDNFADGDFTANPVWGGNTANFFINANGQLQSNGPNLANQNIALSTANPYAKNAVWEFSFRLNFNPTDANYPRVYLVANQADLTGVQQGYFFQIGEAGNSDGLHLYRQNGTSTTKIISGAAKTWASTSVTSARIKITRDTEGNWELYADVGGGTNYTLEGSVTDNVYTISNYFGVNCRYSTASRYNQFIFDDFKISELVSDVTAPKVIKVASVNANTLEVVFDEPVLASLAQNVNNYSLSNGAGNPISANMASANNVVNLVYADNFSSGNYTLTIDKITDMHGNGIAPPVTKQFTYITPYTAKRGDVVFNEIMAAPLATATLLNKEYFELYNTTDSYIIITGWKYKDGSSAITTFAADTLAPKSYRIVCANADVEAYKAFGKPHGISPWAALNNDKDDLNLFLPDGVTVIDFVSYTDAWYRDSNKHTGYALELINPGGSCGGAFNWMASTGANNGTPGAQNSSYNPQHVDNIPPKLLLLTILSNTEIQLAFDKPISASMLTDLNNYSINNGIGKPTAAALDGALNQSVRLTLAKAVEPGVESLLTVTNLLNCGGVNIDPLANTATILITEAIKAGEILISEILFNPKMDGVDFVEVYNPTNKILNLKELTISNPAASGNNGPSKRLISTKSVFIRPKTYWVLTANPSIVQQQYEVKFPSQMIQLASMPAFTNESGSVKLWKDDMVVDELAYNEKMHHELLKEVKGVSLERTSFTKNADAPGNLQSAAAMVGFATPTYKNSQGGDPIDRNSFTLLSKTFSPDTDGFEDVLNIDYKLKENGSLVSIDIYTDRGVLARKLVRNVTLSNQGTLNWNGLDDNGQLCKVGIYVIKTSIFTASGHTENFKQTCVLAAKLN